MTTLESNLRIGFVSLVLWCAFAWWAFPLFVHAYFQSAYYAQSTYYSQSYYQSYYQSQYYTQSSYSITGSYSGTGDITTQPPVPGAPGTPTFSNIEYSTMRVSWTAGSNADSYTIERCTGSGCSSYVGVAFGVTDLFFDDSNLSPGVTYQYRVRGTNESGDGSYSGAAEQTTASCATGPSAANVTGFAWSDTIGWISFSSETDPCTADSYGLSIDEEDGSMSGYMWSSNIGWISANSADLSGCPAAPCTARVEDDTMVGWFRALAGGTAESGGWDGFISLSSTSSPTYGVTLSSGTFSGYAWGGGTTVGWISFSGAGTSTYAVETDFEPCEPTYQCNDLTHYDNLCTTSVNENTECSAGLVCAPGAVPCVLPADATGELFLNPQLVPTGNTTQVSWDADDTISCHVFGENGDSWFGGATGNATSSPILETTLYTLECSDIFGTGTTTVDTEYAVVVPTWVER